MVGVVDMMRTLKLQRFAHTPDGTFGMIQVPDGPTIYTVEDRWNFNRKNVSCIPAGKYRCSSRRFNRAGYDAIQLEDVPGRSFILFHVANTHRDIRGCIGVGTGLGMVSGSWAVINSQEAFDDILMPWFNGETFELDISWSVNPEGCETPGC